ncbi:hypothetical protein OH77DRAFT_532772 [Trametes cingulata]|nr:hypothetical protein OH77DRAFT_532772 [Trametes cingulata]
MSGTTQSGVRPSGFMRQDMSAYTQPGNSASGPGSSQTAGTQPDFFSPEARVVENEARAMRNEERARRREAGEADVEEDEALLELEPSGPGLGEQSGGAGGTAGPSPMGSEFPVSVMAGLLGKGGDDARLSAFAWAMSLQGQEREKALEVLGSMFGKAAAVAEKSKETGKKADDDELLVEGPEVPEDLVDNGRRLDCRLVTLIKLGFHLPFTLCTDAAIEAVLENPSRLVCKAQNDAKGAKVTVVDPYAGWPKETELSSEEWKDAWANFLKVLPEFLAPTGVERFRQHFEFLKGQDKFAVRFPAILRFDMKIRHRYFWGKKCAPFYPGSAKYVMEFQAIRDDVQAEERDARHSAVAPRGRFQPYDRGERSERYQASERGDAGGGDKSFRGGKSHTSAAPLCLICAGSGHRADACTRTKLVNDKPAFAYAANKRIYALAGGAELCLSWNASGKCRYSRCARDATAHACSFCGAAGHNAGSKQCIQH